MTAPKYSIRQKLTAARFLLWLAPSLLRVRFKAWLRTHHVLTVTKDGGPEATVWAHWLFESKRFGSIVLLRFEDGSRDAYHSHAFNCVSWLLSGGLVEDRIAPVDGTDGVWGYLPGPYPIITRREHMHKVTSVGRSWVLSFRGPWAYTWTERTPDGASTTLASGRRAVADT